MMRHPMLLVVCGVLIVMGLAALWGAVDAWYLNASEKEREP